MKTLSAKLTLLVILLFTTNVVHAEKADREKPINIEAQIGEFDDKTQVARFSGNVILTQGTLSLKADDLEIQQVEGTFNKGIATGNPSRFKQKRDGYNDYIEGEADRIIYESATETLRMYGNAKLLRDGDVVIGNFIKYNAGSELFEVKGGELEEARRNEAGRVRITIHPKPKQTLK